MIGASGWLFKKKTFNLVFRSRMHSLQYITNHSEKLYLVITLLAELR